MRFSIKRENFLNGLLVANRAIGAKASNPIVLNVKLDLTTRGLEITGSNGEITIWTLVPNEIDGNQIIHNVSAGSILLDAKKISDIVKKLSGEVVDFDVIDGVVVKIHDETSVFRLNCISSDEYPDIDMEKGTNSFHIDAELFSKIVAQTSFAVLDKDTRPILTTVNFSADNGTLTALATDTFRLSRKIAEVDPSIRFSANIPAKTLNDVVSMIGSNSEIEISATAERIVFSFGNILVISRLIEGEYPVSGSIIPQNFVSFLDVNAAQFLGALDRISVLATDRYTTIKISMDQDSVKISSNNDMTESGVETIATCEFTGKPLEMSFNSGFVAQAIKAIGSEDVTFCFGGEMKAFVIKNVQDNSIAEMVTPLRNR
ncbi:MAG: DNA polymerase III subunit beta [Bacilli bacterium]|nr:DNA polymerase III subunit beta [Bacilli bacterium]